MNYAEMTAKSVMYRRPQINPDMKWEYEDGVVMEGIYQLWKKTNNKAYLDYLIYNIDLFIDGKGSIYSYELEEFNIDHINNGKIILDLYAETKDVRYKQAADLLYKQLMRQPRTRNGSFWHKKIYPYQIWLDGIYMGSVFYAKYQAMFPVEDKTEDILNQFLVCYEHTQDSKTGLMYHAWDEKKEQPWSNDETGTSSNFWCRAMGWYVMAIVDAYEYIPENHRKKELLDILNQLLNSLKKVADKETGLWYQVLDKGEEPSNYLESSGSFMILNAIGKACRLGYIDNTWQTYFKNSYQHALDYFITLTEDNLINVNKICYVGGLGGPAKRDGTYTYYISEPIVTNDHKGVGPFLLASQEYERLQD